MANHKQAKKRNRRRIKQTARNRHVRSTMRNSVRRVTSLIEDGNAADAPTALHEAARQLDRAVTKGVVNRRTASRKISRMTIALHKVVAKT